MSNFVNQNQISFTHGHFDIANLLPIKRHSIVHWIIIPILSKLQDAPEVLGLIVPANLDAKKSQPVTCL